MKHGKRAADAQAFSLVEVVLALAITAFCLISLLGLFSAGINTGRESAEELQAAHLAQSLIATRRAAPAADLPDFPLPPLTASAEVLPTNSLLLDERGNLTHSPADARYRLSYRITLPADADEPVFIYLRLSWSAQGVTPQGAFELVTRVAR